MHSAAAAAGVTFREFRRLNPTFRSDQIPAGTFDVKVPEGSGNSFQQKLEAMRDRPAPAPSPPDAGPSQPSHHAKPEPIKSPAKNQGGTSYTVKKGDTLLGVAQRFKVSADKLRQLNHIKGNNLPAGTKLIIPQN
jgi:membrane-bound lytic murein transglycosylase D